MKRAKSFIAEYEDGFDGLRFNRRTQIARASEPFESSNTSLALVNLSNADITKAGEAGVDAAAPPSPRYSTFQIRTE